MFKEPVTDSAQQRIAEFEQRNAALEEALSASPVHPRTKAAVFAKDETETLYTANFDGMPCRVMKTEHAIAMSKRPLNPLVALARALGSACELELSLGALSREVAQQGPRGAVILAYFGAATAQIRRAIRDGDLERGVELIGQAQGLIDDAPTCAELIRRILSEADAAAGRVAASR